MKEEFLEGIANQRIVNTINQVLTMCDVDEAKFKLTVFHLYNELKAKVDLNVLDKIFEFFELKLACDLSVGNSDLPDGLVTYPTYQFLNQMLRHFSRAMNYAFVYDTNIQKFARLKKLSPYKIEEMLTQISISRKAETAPEIEEEKMPVPEGIVSEMRFENNLGVLKEEIHSESETIKPVVKEQNQNKRTFQTSEKNKPCEERLAAVWGKLKEKWLRKEEVTRRNMDKLRQMWV